MENYTTETITVTIIATTWNNGAKYVEIQQHAENPITGTTTIPLNADRFIGWLNQFKIIK